MAVACSAAPGGETEGSTSEAISYPPFPPTNVAAFGAADLENAYNIPTYLQPHATIAIIGGPDDPSAEADLAVYRAAYGLPACTASTGCFKKVTSTGSTALPVASATSTIGVTMSTALDMASAGCPSCKLLVVELTTDNASELLTAVTTAKGLGASAMVSLGTWSGFDAVPTDDSALKQTGVTVFTSVAQVPGPPGYPALLESYPASSPNVISVGVTNLIPAGAPPNQMVVESAMASGWSGCSPSLKPTGQPASSCAGRMINDVAATGGPVWTFNTFQATPAFALNQSGWSVQGNSASVNIGGIIASSLVAAIFAQTGHGGAGPSYPYLNPSYFNDVTTGKVVVGGVTCAGAACNAGVGYDGPTGVGTPDGMDMAGVNRDLLNLDVGSINQSNPFSGDQGTMTIPAVAGSTSPVFYTFETDTTWASGCVLSATVTGLPQGVTMTNYTPAGSRTEPAADFVLTAAPNATVGQQTTMTIAATACGVTHYTQAEVVVQACVPSAAACEYLQCGTQSDGCGGTVTCGACAGTNTCSSNMCCPPTLPWNSALGSCAPPGLKPPPVHCGGKLPACQ